MKNAWKGWIITEEQRLKMEEGDREALDRFYFENYNHFFALAKNYALRKYREGFGDLYRSEELMQDLYISLPSLNFQSIEFFRLSLRQQFWRGAWSEAWTNYPVTEYRRGAIFKTKFWIDAPRHDNKPDEDERIVDKFVSYPSPYQEQLRALEDTRQERLENDLEGFLKSFLTEKQYELWAKGRIVPAIEIKLRRNADRVIEFLRSHGTPRQRLEQEVLPVLTQGCAARKERTEAARAHVAWELEHLEELSPERRRQVIRNHKRREERKARKARES